MYQSFFAKDPITYTVNNQIRRLLKTFTPTLGCLFGSSNYSAGSLIEILAKTLPIKRKKIDDMIYLSTVNNLNNL